MKLIDKTIIVAELEKRRKSNSKNKLNLPAAFEDNYLLSFLDTLEVKEVDLEKEMGKYLDVNNIEYGFQVKLFDFAKYFFELGMQQSKNDNNNEE